MTIDDPVLKTGSPLSVQLGPGIMNNIFDGIQRPLEDIAKEAKGIPFIPRGLQVPILDHSKEWEYIPTIKVGDNIGPGCI